MLFILLLSFPLWGSIEKSKFLTNRSVEIEWDEVPGATQYDLEVFDGKEKKFIKKFKSKTNVFKLNVRMGKYYFRSRIFDQYEQASEWTDLAELLIMPPATKIKTVMPENLQVYASKNKGTYTFPLSWDAVPGADSYEIIIETPEGVKVGTIKTKKTESHLNIPQGQFQFKVRPLLADGEAGEATAPTPILSVIGPKIQTPKFHFKRDPKEGQVVSLRSELSIATFDGELRYRFLEGNTWVKVKDIKGLKDRKIIFDSTYKPGVYQLKLQARAKGFTPSEFEESEFVVKPTEKILNSQE